MWGLDDTVGRSGMYRNDALAPVHAQAGRFRTPPPSRWVVRQVAVNPSSAALNASLGRIAGDTLPMSGR